MPRTPAWRRYLRFWGSDVDADVDEELRFHLEMRIRDYEARGLPPDEARRAALDRIGDIERTAGALRDHDRRRERERHRREHMSDLLHDVRYGLRTLRHAPAFTAVAAVTLALGIGATTAIFSVVNAVILRPLPYPDPDRLVVVHMDNRRMGMREDIHSYANYADLRDQNRVFSSLATYVNVGYNITGGCVESECEPRRVRASATTANFFETLGVAPALGRTYSVAEEEPGRDAVVVLSHALWTSLGSDRRMVGRTVRLNGREREVIGVMPRDFTFPTKEIQLWIPLALDPDARAQRGSYAFTVIGRLAPGATIAAAQPQMEGIFRALEAQFPSLRDIGVNLVALPNQVIGKSLRTALWIMLAAVGAVLLIACANVANLLLSRAAAREREIGVRLALGATRRRLVRQLLTESVLLAVIGSVLGVLLAWAGLRVLVGIAPADIPRLEQVRLDPFVLGVTLVVAVATGLGFGLVPALQASRPTLVDALREGARGTAGLHGQRVRRVLVGAQVALVVVLLTGAGLLIRSFLELQRVELGFRPENLLTMRVSLPGAKYQPPARAAFFNNLLDRIGQLPGVESAGATTDIFLAELPNSTNITIENRTPTPNDAGLEIPFDAVSPDYFRTMGIALTRGRAFTPADRDSAPQVAIVNEAFAKRFWPGEDPIGKRFKYGGQDDDAPWLTVVGTVADMRRTGFERPVRFETFLPVAQYNPSSMIIVVRTRGAPLAMAPVVRGEVRALDRDLPLYEISSVDQLLSAMVAQRRFSMALLGTFAAVALLLGVVGVYGVTAYLVAQRTREVGLRLALGAEPKQLVGMVVRQGMVPAAIGLGLGLLVALAVTRVMAGLLYDVAPHDLATLLAVTGVLAAATFAANYIPARRAAHIDPLVALRQE
ncbi:MAG TPA: ABC transporter permease [Gemmatimonadaceae bacterium]|nr:ABC transporter permease [Gemmatimonadaceae bacterium]